SGVRASARSHHGRKWHVVARTERYPFPPTVPPVGGEGTEGASHDGPDRVADPPRRGRHHPPHRTSHAAGRGGLSTGVGTRTHRFVLEQARGVGCVGVEHAGGDQG